MDDEHDYLDEDMGDDDDFDYESFVEENFSQNLTNTKTAPLWRLVAVILLLAILLMFFLQVSAMF